VPAIAPRGASAIAITNASPLVIAIFRIIVSSILSPLMDSVTSRIWLDRERSPRADTAGIGPAEETVTYNALAHRIEVKAAHLIEDLPPQATAVHSLSTPLDAVPAAALRVPPSDSHAVALAKAVADGFAQHGRSDRDPERDVYHGLRALT